MAINLTRNPTRYGSTMTGLIERVMQSGAVVIIGDNQQGYVLFHGEHLVFPDVGHRCEMEFVRDRREGHWRITKLL